MKQFKGMFVRPMQTSILHQFPVDGDLAWICGRRRAGSAFLAPKVPLVASTSWDLYNGADKKVRKLVLHLHVTRISSPFNGGFIGCY